MEKTAEFELERETAEKVNELFLRLPEISAREPDKDKILHFLKKRNDFLRGKSRIVWLTSPEKIRSAINPIAAPESNSAEIYRQCAFALSSAMSARFKTQRMSFVSALEGLFSTVRRSERYSEGCFWSFYYFVLWDQYCGMRDYLRESNFAKYLTDAYLCGLGFIVVYDRVIYAVPIPKYTVNARSILHRDLGPAVIWRDGIREYYLNGVRVPRNVAEIPAEKLYPGIILKIKNAEVRREIVRKIGVERITAFLGSKVIDTEGDYELVLLNMKDDRRRPYLKMKNPSIGVYHLEGVPPDTKTIKEALAWRNQSGEQPIVVT